MDDIIINDEDIKKAIRNRINSTVARVIEVKLGRIISDTTERVFKGFFEKEIHKGLTDVIGREITNVLEDFVELNKESITETANKILKDKLNMSRAMSGLTFNIPIKIKGEEDDDE